MRAEKNNTDHSTTAALRIARAVSGSHIDHQALGKGHITFSSQCTGLLHVNRNQLSRVNSIPHFCMATSHSRRAVNKERAIAASQTTASSAPENVLTALEECCASAPVLSVLPFKRRLASIITGNNEIYSGRKSNVCGPILEGKLSLWGSVILSQTIVPDEIEAISEAILASIDQGADLVILTGDMSVAPESQTQAAICRTASQVLGHDTPAFPGAMFMLAYKNTLPVLGLPESATHHAISAFDLIVPQILAGVRITKQDILNLAYGGFYENGQDCR